MNPKTQPQKIYCVILHNTEGSTIAIHTTEWNKNNLSMSASEEIVRWQMEGLITKFNLHHSIDSVILSEEEARTTLSSGEIIEELRANLPGKHVKLKHPGHHGLPLKSQE